MALCPDWNSRHLSNYVDWWNQQINLKGFHVGLTTLYLNLLIFLLLLLKSRFPQIIRNSVEMQKEGIRMELEQTSGRKCIKYIILFTDSRTMIVLFLTLKLLMLNHRIETNLQSRHLFWQNCQFSRYYGGLWEGKYNFIN